MEHCQLHEGLTQRLDKCEADIKKLYEDNNSLYGRQIRVETKLDYITDQIKTMSDKIDKILEKPAKRYDSIITGLAIAAITGLATAFFMGWKGQ